MLAPNCRHIVSQNPDPPPVRPEALARTYQILRHADRPITRGQLAMFPDHSARFTAAEYQSSLDRLVIAGLVTATTATVRGCTQTTYRLVGDNV